MYDSANNELMLRVDALSKEYGLNKHDSKLSIKDIFRKSKNKEQGEVKTVMALKNISFTLSRGESLGIIGANGAGKSTLLKILSGITSPTDGEVKIWGRVHSVLDIGTGFHPDLTGRDNVYLNGEILGLSRPEIDEKYERIVAFSEIGEFIDKPVKFYSSGMYLRLAFSVVLNMDADLLLFDEVLAVGDQFFREKCRDVLFKTTAEKSFIFVSHNMSEIEEICDRVIVLDDGCIVKEDSLKTSIYYYLDKTSKNNEAGKDSSPAAASHESDNSEESIYEEIAKRQLQFKLLDDKGNEQEVFNRQNEIIIELAIGTSEMEDVSLGIYITDYKEFKFMGAGPVSFKVGKYSWKIPSELLLDGYYHLNVAMIAKQHLYQITQFKTFQIEGMGFIVGHKEMPVPIYLNELQHGSHIPENDIEKWSNILIENT